ncbi:OmpA family protein [Arenibacter sp. M-2]|uniref:OmpA family protein n=1 Tax=unclassified Arenibacter TaxID=2615047 RepID=UPI000D75D058|nr:MULTISPECIES: OmpA family protein [unclassified Arenibacter]MDL5511916.1 OmpA family protein [Arenibacter sp. M-2]PXX25617.1 chemotaxis protein MotB [Arenibacter sp. ARW7G5Y1]|tara:strand:- start:8120 stop:8923 length:804 start_codon:yes stop_codon:yes gene_type:complete
MKRIFTILVLLMYISVSQAQSKKDLILEVDGLRSKLRETETALAESKREERIASAKVESYEAQVNELKETNANLLKNLNSFTEASNKRSDHINSTLESLVQKEAQLRIINDAISSHDSITLAVFTQFKQTLGNDPKITVSNGAVAVVMDNSYIFGENSKNFKVQEKAESIIAKIGNILKANPTMDIQIVSNSNLVESKDNKLNNWEIGTQQAAAVARLLENKYQIEPKRIIATGKSELGLYSIETATEIIVQPRFYEFFKLVKESMK